MNISLIGYRGVGKTSLGKKLSTSLGMNFVDVDSCIESKIGNIKDFFSQKGEDEFRKIEASVLKEILKKNSNSVISHGGGVILDNKNIFQIKLHSKVVFLNLDNETILKRINNDTLNERPALTNMPLTEEVASTLKHRLPLYNKCADAVVNLQDSTSEENLSKLLQITTHLKAGHKRKVIDFDSIKLESYKILIQRGIFTAIAKDLDVGNKYLIIADDNISNLYAHDLKQLFENESKECSIINFPAGEKHKSLNTFNLIHEQIDLSLDRQSCIIALGGGVTGDLAGFIASTYMRGISYVQVPTSLLSMVDSSIGGKLGVNTKRGKNSVGVFNNPSRVYIDPLLLVTLPNTYLKDGLVEAIKHGLISNRNYFNFIKDNKENILSMNTDTLTNLIYESIKIKSDIVKKDEKENDIRRVLNFGHTIGHTLEEVCGYGKVSHGYGVAIGSIAASFISLSRGLIDKKIFQDIEEIYSLFNIPTSLQDIQLHVEPQKILDFLIHDKKNVSGKITFVLLKDIGKPLIVDNISKQEVIEAINHVS